MEIYDKTIYNTITLNSIEYAEHVSMLTAYKVQDGAPIHWKLIYGRHTLSELDTANIQYIRRRLDSGFLAWVDHKIHDLIIGWTDSHYANLTLSEYLIKILN